MALTPDDVVTKQFQHVRFKEGFDPDEVDDFLDEIVVEWRKTIEQNEQLKAENERLKAEAAESGSAPAEHDDSAQGEQADEAASGAVVASSAGIIELAQRLHDEYVADGIAQRDQLVSEAQAQATALVSEAEARTREETERLVTERESLESSIADLREFESDYRSQLRSYIEGQLESLDASTAQGSDESDESHDDD